MSAFHRSQIVSSYAKVLRDILLSSNDFETDFNNLQQAVLKFNNVNNLNVSPLIIKEYKQAIKKSSLEAEKDSLLQQFFLTVFERRYGFLLNDIIECTKAKLQNKLNKVRVLVYSCKELSSII